MKVALFAKVTFGDTGAPTLSNAIGIASVTRNSAGKYTFQLSDNYNRLLAVSMTQETGTSAAAAPITTMVSEAVSNSTPTLVIQYRAIDNTTATDPASGEVLHLRIELTNSSLTT